jgi:hypothetical protein
LIGRRKTNFEPPFVNVNARSNASITTRKRFHSQGANTQGDIACQ